MFKEEKYDLYGPFWIMATLIVEIAIVGFINYQVDLAMMAESFVEGNVVNYMSLYSLGKVAKAAFICVGYFIFCPLLIFLITRYVLFVDGVRYFWIFAIYGYSFSIFLIVVLVLVIPVNWYRWCVLVYGGLSSLIFIIVELYTIIKERLEAGWAKFAIIVLFLLATHGIFILTLQLYFLSWT